jgi:putative drug exporter of the RND superfamily
VVAALGGLLVFDVARLRTIASAGVSTTIVALLASLTLTAALMGLAGRRIRVNKPKARAETVPNADHGTFARLARLIQRGPVVALLGSLAVLLLIGTPLLGANIKVLQLEGLPPSMEALQVANQLDSRFGETTQPSVEVVAATTPTVLDRYADQWRTDPAVLRVEPATADSPGISSVILAVHGDDQGPQARALVQRLRADRPVGYQSWVGGDAATLIDLDDRLLSGLPWAIGVMVIAMAVLLFAMTGSVVMPLKVVLLNAISLTATFGVLTAIFQNGWLAGPLGMLVVGGLSPYMIMIVFAFAFGLSMDYEMFLLARIKEQVDAGEPPDAAVRIGLQRTGRVITSAALLMLVVFACFASASDGDLQQVGTGLFVAVLVDATLVRCVLVPATMTLLGRAAWWAPGPLRRLHARFGLHHEPDTGERHEPLAPAGKEMAQD